MECSSSFYQKCSLSEQTQEMWICVYFCTKNNYILSNLGYCSEYNTMGNVIQEHYYAECTEHDVPCPSFYNSAESYKCKFRKICKRYAWTDCICGYMFI